MYELKGIPGTPRTKTSLSCPPSSNRPVLIRARSWHALPSHGSVGSQGGIDLNSAFDVAQSYSTVASAGWGSSGMGPMVSSASQVASEVAAAGSAAQPQVGDVSQNVLTVDGQNYALPSGPTRGRFDQAGNLVIEAQDGSWRVAGGTQQSPAPPQVPAPPLPPSPGQAFRMTLAQEGADIAYGTQRAAYGFADNMVNGFFQGDTTLLNGQESFTTGVPLDWSRNAYAYESDRSHYWTTTIGGNVTFAALLGGGIGAAGSLANRVSLSGSAGTGGYGAFQSKADAIMQEAYASRGLTPNGMRVQVDPGIPASINLQETNIVYREISLNPDQLAAVRPFDQALSDAGGQPIRAVIGDQGAYIMQGNHRIFGATLDNVNSVNGILYTPQQWESFTGSKFNPALGTTAPYVR